MTLIHLRCYLRVRVKLLPQSSFCYIIHLNCLAKTSYEDRSVRLYDFPKSLTNCFTRFWFTLFCVKRMAMHLCLSSRYEIVLKWQSKHESLHDALRRGFLFSKSMLQYTIRLRKIAMCSVMQYKIYAGFTVYPFIKRTQW